MHAQRIAVVPGALIVPRAVPAKITLYAYCAPVGQPVVATIVD